MIPYRQFCSLPQSLKPPLTCDFRSSDCCRGRRSIATLVRITHHDRLARSRNVDQALHSLEVSRAVAGARVGAVQPRRISGISTTGGGLSPRFAQPSRKGDRRRILLPFRNGARWHLGKIRNSSWPFAPADVTDENTNALCLFSFGDVSQNLRNSKCHERLCCWRKCPVDGDTPRFGRV